MGAAPTTGAWVDLRRHPDATTRPGVLVVRPEGGLFYANADAVRRAILALVDDSTRAVVLDAQTVPALDVSAADMLAALGDELAVRLVRFLIARDVGQVRDVLDHTEAADLGRRAYPTVRDAITALDPPSDKSDG